ncbi:MAG: RecX family transcriptional regulator [Proteobacteria bacterium]|nr:RecX family transcriptional regulator [Pseudomonadota bacterium]
MAETGDHKTERPNKRRRGQPNSLGARQGQDKKRTPRKATPKYLENAALHYLSRYATSAANLRRVMMLKVDRSARFHGTDAAEGRVHVEDMIRRFERSHLLDDAAYARARAESLHRRGNSARMIRSKLGQKGVAQDVIGLALEALGEDAAETELAAAAAYARRRRLGPYGAREPSLEQREKQLASLARAGFSYDVARRVLEV